MFGDRPSAATSGNVLRLAEALAIPLRERNTLLLAAGYASFYRQTSLDAPEMEAARHGREPFRAATRAVSGNCHWRITGSDAAVAPFESGVFRNWPGYVALPGSVRTSLAQWKLIQKPASDDEFIFPNSRGSVHRVDNYRADVLRPA